MTHAIPGHVYTIAESQGRLAGANLFHSFESFGVGSGDAAVFTTVTPALANVISRVSGSSATQINGLLALVPGTGGAPNFFFINPAGVTFGAGAQVDVPGAFHVSTANRLRFGDGIVFAAGNGSDSTLSVAPPEAFGFLRGGGARVEVKEGAVLAAFPGHPLSVTGGEVRIDAGLLLTSDGGNLRVAAVGSDAVEVPLQGPMPRVHGLLEVLRGAGVFARDGEVQNSGSVAVSAGDILIDGMGTLAGILSEADFNSAGDVLVTATGRLAILNGGQISSGTNSFGTAGSIVIEAGSVEMDSGFIESFSFFGAGDIVLGSAAGVSIANGSSIRSYVFGFGNGGGVKISAGEDFSLSGGSLVYSYNFNLGYGAGNAGSIEVGARNVVIDGQGGAATGIASQTSWNTSGRSGDIRVTARQDLTVRNNGVVLSSTASSGDGGAVEVQAGGMLSVLNGAEITTWNDFLTGAAGPITVRAASVLIDGEGSAKDTGISSQANFLGLGPAGDIDVAVTGSLVLLREGLIVSSTESFTDAGAVRVEAADITIDGQGSTFFTGISSLALEGSSGNGGAVTVRSAGGLSVLDGGLIHALSYGPGNSGPLSVEAASISIDGKGNPGVLDPQGSTALTGVGSLAYEGGIAGPVTITTAGNLELANRAEIRSRNSGEAGSAELTVSVSGDLSVTDAMILSSTFGGGSGAPVSVSAGGGLAVADSGSILSVTLGAGAAGDVSVTAGGAVALTNVGQISSLSNQAAGNAGSIIIVADSLTLDDRGSGLPTVIASLAFGGPGNAGDVSIRVAGGIDLLGGQVSSRSQEGGHAGNVTVTAGSIALDGRGLTLTGVFSDSQGDRAGDAGRIEVVSAGPLSVRNGATISASTFSPGNAGSVKVRAQSIVLDGRGSANGTGIATDSERDASGTAGTVDVLASGDMSIIDAFIGSDTYSVNDAGHVEVRVGGNLRLEAGAQISSDTWSAGKAGDLAVTVQGKLALDASVISSSTDAQGDAGSIQVTAGSLDIDGRHQTAGMGIRAGTSPNSSGHGGDVRVVVAGYLSIVDGGAISSSTNGTGAAGSVRVDAGNIAMDAHGGGVPTGIHSATVFGSGAAGNVEVNVAGDLSVAGAASIASNTFTIGHASAVAVSVGGMLSVVQGGNISSSTTSAGDAGSVTVRAGAIEIAGQNPPNDTGILAQTARGSSGQAGSVEVSATGMISLASGGLISSRTNGTGDGGPVRVEAGSIALDGSGTTLFTGISSDSGPSASGHAGRVEVSATSELTVANKAFISSDALSMGNASDVAVSAPRILVASGGQISSSTSSAGNAGSVDVTAGRVDIDGGGDLSRITGIVAIARLGSSGDAGDVRVGVSDHLAMVAGGVIGSTTNASGDAGLVDVRAGSITADGRGTGAGTGISSASIFGSGNAGPVTVSVAGRLSLVDGGFISSSADFTTGAAGAVSVEAQDIEIAGRGGSAGIIAVTGVDSSGGGKVVVSSRDRLALTDGGVISVSTLSAAGGSGEVMVSARTLQVDGQFSEISASAAAGSSGQTGNLTVGALRSVTLSDGGSLSIRNDAHADNPARLTPTLLAVSAPIITLKDAQITAASTDNVAASDIRVEFSDRLVIDPSGITTSASLGDGGDITIAGSGLIWLDHSFITTSTGSGNGGDISIRAGTLVLETGFIQANTGGAGSSGGNVSIAVQALLSSGNTLSVGDPALVGFQADAFGFNVIQAAAPSGVSGTIAITRPLSGIAGELSGLEAEVVDTGPLGKDLCRAVAGSSLTPVGRGGLRPSAAGLIRPEQSPSRPATAATPAATEHMVARASYDCR